LAKLTSSSGYSETYRYDSFGRATETLTAFDGKIFPVTTVYDQYGRTAALTYPTSFAVSHVYNDLGYLQEVRRADNNQSVWQAETMNARGQLEKQRFGNGLVTQRAYDPLTGHLQTIQSNISRSSPDYQ
jgi:YD repeat-containing protein